MLCLIIEYLQSALCALPINRPRSVVLVMSHYTNRSSRLPRLAIVGMPHPEKHVTMVGTRGMIQPVDNWIQKSKRGFGPARLGRE